MTLDEKLEIIKAYANGETVEELIESCGMSYWRQVTLDNWNFEYNKYRIKPNSEPKFKIGEFLVDKNDEGRANPEIYRCINVTNNMYLFDGGVGRVERTKEFVHNNYLRLDDVLWFFTGVTKANTRVLLNDVMCTTLDAIKSYGKNIRNIEPIYAMGFRQIVTENEETKWERVVINSLEDGKE